MIEKKYSFQFITHCNMCGEPADRHKVLGRRLNTSQGFRPKNKVGITTTVVKCNNCKLVYSNPLAIPLNIQDHYGMDPEEYWPPSYFHLSDDYLGNLPERLAKYIDFNSNPKSLDIGAGIGKGMISLSRLGFTSFGIEPSNTFHEMALNKMGVSGDQLLCQTIEEADFESEKFDFITFGAVLEHLYSPSESIEKALKWLKPGGIIQIAVPSSNWLVGKIINAAYKLRFYDFVGNLSPMHPPYHLYEFDKKSFDENAKRMGYEIADVRYGVCQTMLPTTLDPILKPLMKRTNTGMEIYVLLRKK